MARSGSPVQPISKQNFRSQWILTNGLWHGVSMGLPLLVADLLGSQDKSTYIVVSIFFYGMWVGVQQWLFLRLIIPLSGWWTGTIPLAILLSLTLLTKSLSESLSSGYPYVEIFAIYPLLISFSQWLILRRIVKSAWLWIITSVVAIDIGLVVVGIGIALTVDTKSPILPLGISTLVGGSCYGLIYGAITSVGLRYLLQRVNAFPTAATRLDVPPGDKSWKTQGIPLLVFLILFGIWLRIFPSPPASIRDNSTLLFVFPYMFAYNQLSILVHELGHLVFAVANGFDFQYLAVDRWLLIREQQGLVFRRSRHRFAGGFVSTIPRSFHDLNRRLWLMIFGGPFASFILFWVSLIPLLFQDLVRQQFIAWFIAFYSVYNLYLAIFNAIPLKLGYASTDGRRMLDLTRRTPQGQRFAAFYGVNASLRQGIRPRDIVPELIAQGIAMPEQSMDHISGLLYAYWVELDREDFEQAGQYLDQTLEMNLHYPALFRGSLLLEGAYFEAHIRHHPDLARQWFSQIPDTTLLEPCALLRAEAAVLLSEGDRKTALLKAKQGLIETQNHHLLGGKAIAESKWLQALLREIQAV
jgi:hypothetical protein